VVAGGTDTAAGGTGAAAGGSTAGVGTAGVGTVVPCGSPGGRTPLVGVGMAGIGLGAFSSHCGCDPPLGEPGS
jgi:hypothetical protein